MSITVKCPKCYKFFTEKSRKRVETGVKVEVVCESEECRYQRADKSWASPQGVMHIPG